VVPRAAKPSLRSVRYRPTPILKRDALERPRRIILHAGMPPCISMIVFKLTYVLISTIQPQRTTLQVFCSNRPSGRLADLELNARDFHVAQSLDLTLSLNRSTLTLDELSRELASPRVEAAYSSPSISIAKRLNQLNLKKVPD
jgi:hypothetical protein